MSPIPPSRAITARELRERFNQGRYYERALAGEFIIKRAKEHPPGPGYSFPPGTLSQTMHYLDVHGTEIVEVHQYLLPDGTLHNGRPDPKRLFEGGVIYFALFGTTIADRLG